MTPSPSISNLARLAKEATPRPWNWNVSLQSKQVRLEGSPSRGLEIVMDFVRWGMDGAQPRFRSADCLMVKTETLAVPVVGREHHASWFRDIDHPDARFIVSAANSHDALLEVARCAQAVLASVEWREASAEEIALNHAMMALNASAQGGREDGS